MIIWITPEEAASATTMQEAIDLSIKHWKQIAESTIEDYARGDYNIKNCLVSDIYCALCKYCERVRPTGKIRCTICPLAEKFGVCGAAGSLSGNPWYTAHMTFNRSYKDWGALRSAARGMVVALESLKQVSVSDKLMKKYPRIYQALWDCGFNDKGINGMTAREIFREYLAWEGIIGYENLIIESLEAVMDVTGENISALILSKEKANVERTHAK